MLNNFVSLAFSLHDTIFVIANMFHTDSIHHNIVFIIFHPNLSLFMLSRCVRDLGREWRSDTAYALCYESYISLSCLSFNCRRSVYLDRVGENSVYML